MLIVDRLPTAAPPARSLRDLVVLTWEERAKTHQRVTTQAGREIGIKLPTGTPLLPGTVLYVGDGFHVEVSAASEEVWLIRTADVPTLLRAAYEIGNRHFPIAICDDSLAVLYDHTLAELWVRLGIVAQRVRQPFLSVQRPSHHQGA
jgi:urease accessory protein